MSERVLLDSPAVGLLDVRCASPVSGHGPAEWLRGPRLVLPQRGVFIWRQRQHSAVAHAGMALIPLALEEYTVAHPIEGGDWCLVLVLGDELADRLQARLRVHTLGACARLRRRFPFRARRAQAGGGQGR